MAHFKVTAATRLSDGSLRVNGVAYSNVPSGSNDAGVSWSQVAVEYRRYQNRDEGRTTDARVPVDSATQAELDSGSVFEWFWEVVIPSGTSNPVAIQLIRDHINTQEPTIRAQLGDRLRYWGFEGDS